MSLGYIKLIYSNLLCSHKTIYFEGYNLTLLLELYAMKFQPVGNNLGEKKQA